jgi:hypothetical protein
MHTHHLLGQLVIPVSSPVPASYPSLFQATLAVEGRNISANSASPCLSAGPVVLTSVFQSCRTIPYISEIFYPPTIKPNLEILQLLCSPSYESFNFHLTTCTISNNVQAIQG